MSHMEKATHGHLGARSVDQLPFRLYWLRFAGAPRLPKVADVCPVLIDNVLHHVRIGPNAMVSNAWLGCHKSRTGRPGPQPLFHVGSSQPITLGLCLLRQAPYACMAMKAAPKEATVCQTPGMTWSGDNPCVQVLLPSGSLKVRLLLCFNFLHKQCFDLELLNNLKQIKCGELSIEHLGCCSPICQERLSTAFDMSGYCVSAASCSVPRHARID